ncbi:hypothetical protein [Thiocystis violacea]|uniref:hypothetical protein n=1 Tax=Thiocystis violacea TaxID=13725 RepID=UPI0019037C5F|nr:hypothetical protein [Thiocystis violacea]MBK1722903.1 hypothetical protein [Thiocystis violacea]
MDLKARIPLSKTPSLDALRLRPYGASLLTPAVETWLGFAWSVILLMASIEGIVWGLVGATMIPRDHAWLGPIAGLFMFALMFAIIWIVDASLIMSERPVLRARRWSQGPNQGVGAVVRWGLGILVRLAIVAISLYVTAPFLAKLIRADDIAAYHQRQVERYFNERDQQLQALIAARGAQIETSYRERIGPLQADIERLTQTLALERQRRSEIEAEDAPEIAILRNDLTAARQRVGDEILGRGGRPEGRGPEARKWETNVNLLAAELAAKESQMQARVAEVAQRIKTLEATLRTQTQNLQQLGQAHQTRIDQIVRELEAEQVDAVAPKLSFAARSKALQALRESPEEAGVPHFETVEGFAQAALGVLFFSLIALKLFEPPAVRAYFSETIQMQYRKYLAGGLGDIPGFELPKDPTQRCNPPEFARLWQAYEKDPAGFYADRKTLVEVREPLTRYLADQALEHDRLVHRRENLEHEMLFARRRREHELIAFERELHLRTAQLQAQLANETRALKDHRRIELAAELQQARADWRQRQTQAEEELRQLREGFEQEQSRAQGALRLREKEIERLQTQSLAEIRQAEVARQLAHQQKLTEAEAKRRRESHKTRLAGVREEISRLRTLETRQRAERQTLRETGRKQQETIDATRSRVEDLQAERAQQQAAADALSQALADHATQAGETGDGRKTGFWAKAEKITEDKRVRDVMRDLKALEKTQGADAERLAKLQEELHALRLRKASIDAEIAEADTRIAATQMRIQLYEDGLSALLGPDDDGNKPEKDAPLPG